MERTFDTDTKYRRFLNATLLLFTVAQLPILALLVSMKLWAPVLVNSCALALCGLGFMLNRDGRFLLAKTLVLTVLIGNTVYFSIIFGSTAPTHFWLIPMSVLGVLVFKPSERIHMLSLVGVSMLSFLALELVYLDLEPLVGLYDSLAAARHAAQGSTISAIVLTLILVGMMHRRFAQSESSLSAEKNQSERLLRAILPDEIAHELRETGQTKAVRHEDVSILFTDIVGFTPLARSMSADDVVAMLAEVFKRFDELIEECGVEKIKTIGDAYMVAGGLPKPVPDHAERITRCAFGMLDIIKSFSEESGYDLQLRIGLHRGSAVAGVIGTTKFAYDMWGESVNLASRLEASGEPGRIHVSDAFRLGLVGLMEFETRGEIQLKGVGPTYTYWLTAGS